ncbi:variable surface protein [Plasmodium gonderi]|uniref:Variable surface protein n=1 Tax=Plasmodium gonderi TaxID=77519 RepID=A0A1Y1JSX2_PLAGO|nr:variable surface protein [Plasmodium gonderi]GAW84555.1 variable surface protein [Plasmodium gonderi]
MGKFIYEIVKKFPECKKMLDEKEIYTPGIGGIWINACKGENNILKKFIDVKTKAEYVCIQAMDFLATVNSPDDINLDEAGCEFFSYWIYSYVLKMNKEKADHIQSIYSDLLNLYSVNLRNMVHKCKNKEKSITNDYVRELAALYHIYINDDIIKSKCAFNRNVDFCNELEYYVKQYNIQINRNKIETKEVKIMLPCKTSILVPITITIVISLLISIFLFILYNSTSYGSWFRRSILRIINRWINRSEEKHMLERPEIYSSSPRISSYDVLYHIS